MTKKTIGDKTHYAYGGTCTDCGKQIATQSARCRRCQGKRRTKLNTDKRLKEAGYVE